VSGQVQPCVPRQHRDEHQDAVDIDPCRGAPRRPVAGWRDQRLDLDRQRARPLEGDGDGTAGHRRLLRFEEEAARIGHLNQAVAPHLEHADLIGRAVPVLGGAKEAGRPHPLALKIDDGVDKVLQRARPRHRALLGDVADQRDAGCPRLGDLGEARRHLAHLPDAAGRASQLGAGEGLDTVDDRQRWSGGLDRGNGRRQVGAGYQPDPLDDRPDPFRAAADL